LADPTPFRHQQGRLLLNSITRARVCSFILPPQVESIGKAITVPPSVHAQYRTPKPVCASSIFGKNANRPHISRLHRRDITALLKGLVDHGMLVPDGQGRATSYRLAGTKAVDLASAMDLDSPFKGSEDLGTSSEGLGSSSEGLGTSSEGLDPQHEHYEPVMDPALLEIALPVSSKGKAKPEVVKSTLMALCSGRFLTLNELAVLVNRSPVDLRQRFIKAMVDAEKILERRYPQQPNHEQQAYRTREP